MEGSDDEDPLALLPKKRHRTTVLHEPFQKSDVDATTTAAPIVDVVPTSDSEEAQEDLFGSKGWGSCAGILTDPSIVVCKGSGGPAVGAESGRVGTLTAVSRMLGLECLSDVEIYVAIVERTGMEPVAVPLVSPPLASITDYPKQHDVQDDTPDLQTLSPAEFPSGLTCPSSEPEGRNSRSTTALDGAIALKEAGYLEPSGPSEAVIPNVFRTHNTHSQPNGIFSENLDAIAMDIEDDQGPSATSVMPASDTAMNTRQANSQPDLQSPEVEDVLKAFGDRVLGERIAADEDMGIDPQPVKEQHEPSNDAIANHDHRERTSVDRDISFEPFFDTEGPGMMAESAPTASQPPSDHLLSPLRNDVASITGSPVRPTGSLPRARTRSPSLSPAPAISPGNGLAPRPASPSPTPQLIEPELDPALLAFQNARTFRRRTAIQLQPYTREKTKYRAMVRKGGRLLIAELLHDDPDRVAITASLQESGDSQFREDQPEVPDEPEIDMAVSPPVTPNDQDYAEHFQLYGEVADETTDPRLQALAKTRLRLERQEAKRKARAEREARQYMAFLEKEIKERERVKRLEEKEAKRKLREEKLKERQVIRVQSEPDTPRARRPVPKQRSTTKRSVPVAESSSGSENDIQPSVKRRKLVRRAGSSEAEGSHQTGGRGELRESRTASPLRVSQRDDMSQGDRDDSHSRIDAFDSHVGPFEEFDFEMGDDELPELTFDIATSPRVPLSSSRTINLATPISIPATSDDSDSSEKIDGPREKVKALKRVMPALLAKKLADKAEADYQARQRRKALKAREAEAAARARPGQAVRRKANAPSHRQGVEGLFDDDPSVGGDDETPHYALERPPDPMISIFTDDEQDDDSVLPSDSGGSSHESQYQSERVRQFQVGDFASLLHGPRKARPTKLPPKQGSKALFNRPRVDARQQRKSQSRRPQEHAGMPHSPVNLNKVPAKRPRRKRRILDDRTIFEVETSSAVATRARPRSGTRDQLARPVEKRAFTRTPSAVTAVKDTNRNSASPVRSGLDLVPEPVASATSNRHATVSEASDMWDDLQDFQIDFAIKPLQTGVGFGIASFIGSGKLRNHIDYLDGRDRLSAEESIEAIGLAFETSMEVSAFIALLPIAFDKIKDDVLAVMNDRLEPQMSAAPRLISFLISYLANADCNDSDLRQVQLAFQALEGNLQDLSVPRSTRDRTQAFFLLEVRLSLAIAPMVLSHVDERVESPTAYDYDSSVCEQITAVLEGLLRYGFDRTMKPLKAIMNFEAEDGIVNDFSAECWVAVLHLASCWDRKPVSQARDTSTLQQCLDRALNLAFEGKQAGPRASERIWYLTIGLAALSQFDNAGKVPSNLSVPTRWFLVRKALSSIKIVSPTEEEETKRRHQLKPRDKYIKIMVIRCLQLTSVWRWHCDRESFNIATKDLGVVFRDRALRGLPNETFADFPVFIRQFNRTLAEEIDMEESAYNLYLQLVCLCASDIVTMPSSLDEAKQAAADVKRLMLSIVPFSPVRYQEGKVPTDRQLSALINRFSTAVIAAIFDITLMPYLLGNTRKWINFASADTESRRTCIRGLMYLGVAARHHGESLTGIVGELSSHFEVVQREKSRLEAANASDRAILEHGRLLVLIVSCFKTLICTHSFDAEVEAQPRYPDPELLAPCKFFSGS